MAISIPCRQYRYPATTPNTPFKTTARVTTSEDNGTSSAVAGRCPSPNSTADGISDLSSADTHSAYGAGFRYLIARRLGMRVGIDVAKGPEETYWYLIVGSAW